MDPKLLPQKRTGGSGGDSPRPTKKIKREDFSGPNVSPITSTVPVQGNPFRQQLDEVGSGGRISTQLGTTFPVKFRSEGVRQREQHQVNAVYQLKEQVRANDQQKWTQGMMTGFGHGTTWNEILPQTLTLDSATKYGRAIKSIMGVPVKTSDLGDYTAPATRQVKRKATGVEETVRNTPSDKRRINDSAAKSDAFSFMSPAVTSFVEDLTGLHAANTRFTGSAVRATFLRAKLALGNDPSTHSDDDKAMLGDFKGYLSGHLSQLKKDGAADLADQVSAEHKRSGTSATASNYQATAFNLHEALNTTIDHTFDRKKAKFEAKWDKYTNVQKMDPVAAQVRIGQKLGKWWSEAARTGVALDDHAKDAYQDHKRSRYGIGRVE
ncbi:hypothetical protein GCM10007860_21350 [Chitiniphilus shinanonensis]|uniref:Uncharacterized protein n=1 Tax=Chitiniphilus shinanonensis TaxID=553088 RepID=A0ABQ6BT66_9NEIS|nr:hypothetical protein [Chitiniphilus shinanonensis]GLS04986.1 hypothetical protein GCM10007860_21350 [Chitiniphilus shinanonensis]